MADLNCRGSEKRTAEALNGLSGPRKKIAHAESFSGGPFSSTSGRLPDQEQWPLGWTKAADLARQQRYLSADLSTAADHSKVVKAVTAENEIFEPDEMVKLLSNAPPHMVPGMAVKAFSGLRTEEVIVIEWPDLRFARNCIILSKFITKLDQRRFIKLTGNLKAWLLPYRKDEGRICETWTTPNSVAAAWKRHGKSVGVKTGKNKFRNSHISYRMAETNDPKKVAMESGNSEETIERDYREVTTPEEAKKWFSIFPGQVSAAQPEDASHSSSTAGDHPDS